MEPHRPSNRMPGGFQPTFNRHMKGACKARREALGLPDPEPTSKRKRKIPKHRRQQISVGKGHICQEYPCYSHYHRCNRPDLPNNNGRLEPPQGWSPRGYIDQRNFQAEQTRCMQMKEDMIYLGIMPEAPSSLTLRRFGDFAAASRRQEEHRYRAEREHDQFEQERKRRNADDFYVYTVVVTIALVLACFSSLVFLV